MPTFNVKDNNGFLSYAVLQHQLAIALADNKLLDVNGYTIGFGHMGMIDCDILVTTWETTKIPNSWKKYQHNYLGIIVGSQWNYDIFRAGGVENVSLIPFGIDAEFFGAQTQRLKNKKNNIVFFANNHRRKGLDILLDLWESEFRDGKIRLQIVGRNIDKYIRKDLNYTIQGKFKVTADEESGISFFEPLERLSTAELIKLYQNSLAVILPSRSEGFGLVALEALCSGTQCIIPNYAATNELAFGQSVFFDGEMVPDDGAELGFGYNGSWWKPVRYSLSDAIKRSADASIVSGVSENDRIMISSKYNWNIFVRTLSALMDDMESIGHQYRTSRVSRLEIFKNKLVFKSRRFFYGLLRFD
jgi:glycosyltransferase involved in cell wall biosynthesis